MGQIKNIKLHIVTDIKINYGSHQQQGAHGCHLHCQPFASTEHGSQRSSLLSHQLFGRRRQGVERSDIHPTPLRSQQLPLCCHHCQQETSPLGHNQQQRQKH